MSVRARVPCVVEDSNADFEVRARMLERAAPEACLERHPRGEDLIAAPAGSRPRDDRRTLVPARPAHEEPE